MAEEVQHPEGVPLHERGLTMLLDKGHVNAADVERARLLAASKDTSPLNLLNQTGVVSDERLADIYAELSGYPVATIDHIENMGSNPLSLDFMRQTRCLYSIDHDTLYIVDPLQDCAQRGLTFALNRPPQSYAIIALNKWQSVIANIEPETPQELSLSDIELEDASEALSDQSRNSPLVRKVASWFSQAASLGASDIHFEAHDNRMEILYRIDGQLRPISQQPREIGPSIISRLKVLTDLDMGERYRSQDGRATLILEGRKLDVRISIIPTLDGESAVVRLLDRAENLLSLETLGFDESTITQIRRVLQKRQGLFVVAGPTGSGKTTTLYACLQDLKDSGLKVLSVEDPVEYHFAHVSQVQVSPKTGLTFANTLRSFLRHDPDVIMVGEIRDNETAQTAVQAALTGHLVIATIHAIDTARVRARLIDMGVEAFRLDACLSGALAQRLVRKLCPHCTEERAIHSSEKAVFEAHAMAIPSKLFEPVGCKHCEHEGYAGRFILSELDHGKASKDASELANVALRSVSDGITTLSEVTDLVLS